ncbi:hypothetical protein SAMN05216326_10331 [Nitrosomonas marina]|uniref:AB hydrolase-1 domain-containing protein n=1 Tax=Nitrosomonas marina TaxID=917 RepID=A0A1H9Z053_9PROT|nr:alpha/beta hydrolase [Nitrosomonas marina]SES74869.1 hypothetical protein SAMN05216326_10331 [Nitrosomonas marina]
MNSKRLVCIFLMLVLTGIYKISLAYGYPITDPFEASVLGTPKELKARVPDKIDIKTQQIRVFEDRKTPEVFWYNESLTYTMATQAEAAPLIFIIAGTGSNSNSPKADALLKIFYQAGFHVVALGSPTHPNFIVSASTNSVPGNIQEDSEDLYNVMQLIWKNIRNDVAVTEFYLTGYSLGGAQSAFISKLDEKRRVFDFSKVLMINPPVNLYNSVSILDDLLVNNVPGGLNKIDEFMVETMDQFSTLYSSGNFIDTDEEFLYEAFKRFKDDRKKLAAVIGISFRISAAEMYFTSDVVNNEGYIVPKNLVLTSTSSLTDYMIVSLRISFVDYFNEYFYPYFQTRHSNLSKQALIASTSLESIEDYLANSTKIGLMTNQDDFILAPGEINYLKKVFKSRAKIYPNGGHCGNIDYKENAAYMVDFFNN